MYETVLGVGIVFVVSSCAFIEPLQFVGQIIVEAFAGWCLSSGDVEHEHACAVHHTFRACQLSSGHDVGSSLLTVAQQEFYPRLGTLPQGGSGGLGLAKHPVGQLAHLSGFLLLDVADEEFAWHGIRAIDSLLGIVDKVLQ